MSPSAQGTAGVTLSFGGVPIVVTSTDDRLLNRVNTYFRRFSEPARRVKRPRHVIEAVVGDPEAIKVPLRSWDGRGKESFADDGGGRTIRKDRTGTVIRMTAERWRISGDLHRGFSQLINVIATAYGIALLDRGASMVHASGLVQDGAAIAVVGESGSGKSSVAVRLLERGFDFLSNDRVIIRAGSQSVMAYGLPKQPRVNPGTLLAGERTTRLLDEDRRRIYRSLPDKELWKVEDKHDLDIGTTLGRRWVPFAPLTFAVALQWRHGGKGLMLEQLDPAQTLESLRGAAKTFGPFDLHLEERSDAPLRSLARSIPLYRVTGAIDPPKLAAELAIRCNRAAS